MKLKKYLDEYTVIKPVEPKPDKKSWSLIDSYTAKKVKSYIKKNKLKFWRIVGSYESHNSNWEKQITVNFDTIDMESHSITINLKTGDVYKE